MTRSSGRPGSGTAVGLIACAVTCGLAVGSAEAGPGTTDPAPRVVVLAGIRHVVATSGAGEVVTHLANGDTTVLHLDAPPGIPLPLRGHLQVHRGQRVVIDTTRAALSIDGALSGPTGPTRSRMVRATRLDAQGHRWALVVPNPRRSGVDRLNIEVIYQLTATGVPDQLVGYAAGITLAARAAG